MSKTNDQALKACMKEINNNDYAQMITRERLLHIAEQTKKAVQANPDAFYNPIFSINTYISWADIIIKHLKFD